MLKVRSRKSGNGKYSKQPRFNLHESSGQPFMSILNVVEQSLEAPDYVANSNTRDIWLREHLKKEPNLSGIMKSAVDIDKNRGWRLIGGRNQVIRFTDIMHSFQAAPGLVGWRPSIAFSSQSFWGTDLGTIIELGREGRDGPLRALYTVDPTVCTLTGDHSLPLKYTSGKTKSAVEWRSDDFLRIASLPSTDEKMYGLGYCAVSRCIELSVLMIAIYEHDKEKLSARAAKGLLLLKGISRKNWETAMEFRDADLDAEGMDYYGAIAVIASMAQSVDAKMIALSELPQSFNLREWMDMLMFGYALCWGYDASEFWPVQFGALGRGTETEIQHEKATGKGKLDFPLGFQEQLQQVLPKTLQFEFDQRDEKGDLIHAQVNQAWSEVVRTLYESSAEGDVRSLLSWEESRVMLSRYGVIPANWAPDEAVLATDISTPDSDDSMDIENVANNPPEPSELEAVDQTNMLRRMKDELRSRPNIVRAALYYPDEPLVQYNWPANSLVTLWSRADEILKPTLWSGANVGLNDVKIGIE